MKTIISSHKNHHSVNMYVSKRVVDIICSKRLMITNKYITVPRFQTSFTSTFSLGSLSVGNTVLTRYPYNFDGVRTSVTYTPDSSCQKQQT